MDSESQISQNHVISTLLIIIFLNKTELYVERKMLNTGMIIIVFLTIQKLSCKTIDLYYVMYEYQIDM